MKQDETAYLPRSAARRPFTGAWIETTFRAVLRACGKVAPSRGRGLKREVGAFNAANGGSPLHGGVD